MKSRKIRVLLIGSGAREHAYWTILSSSNLVELVFVAPGNGGIPDEYCVPLVADNISALLRFCTEQRIDWIVCGPEKPLVMGLADEAAHIGIPVFGPSKAAARLEGSKVFTKNLCKAHGIPTSDFRVFGNYTEAYVNLASRYDYPVVIKIDGLAGGKGVEVVERPDQGFHALRQMLNEKKFGKDGGDEVVIEHFVKGPEFSLFGFCRGPNVILRRLPARDYKRRTALPSSPNTGGMGAYAPAGDLDDSDLTYIKETFFTPALTALVGMGKPYNGLLYAGLKGESLRSLQLIEYNCRDGDPETQVSLSLYASDPVPLMLSCSNFPGSGPMEELTYKPLVAVGVNVVDQGYPGKVEGGKLITGIPEANKIGFVYHAGTKHLDGKHYTAGGRVVTCVALGPDREHAKTLADEMASNIEFDGADYRQDIAA